MWFYSGTSMKDGTPITIAARTHFEVEQCRRQGLRPLEGKKKKKTLSKASPSARSKKTRRSLEGISVKRGVSDIEG